MKSIFTCFILSIFFSSCGSTYFFSTLDSKNAGVEKQDNGDFLIETDSLWIAYCFKGENAPVMITVYNKLDKPLYVDWEKSALVINGDAFSYVESKLNLSGGGDFYQYESGYGTSDFSGTIEKKENQMFIPPKSKASYSSLKLNFNFESLGKDMYQDGYMLGKGESSHKVKRISFDEETTPIHIKSYLTIYEKPEKPMTFEQEFFLKGVVKTKAISPKDLSSGQIDRGDFFYSIKPANNRAVGIFWGVGVVGAAFALDAAVMGNK